jgi:hypothetical protein
MEEIPREILNKPKIDIKKLYTDAQKKATKKYRENNIEKVKAQRKLYYEKRKTRDPGFLEYKRNKAKEYYHIKKIPKTVKEFQDLKEKVVLDTTNELLEDVKNYFENIIDNISPVKEVLNDEPLIDIEILPVVEKPDNKRKRGKKAKLSLVL